jgi:hypothetical protein
LLYYDPDGDWYDSTLTALETLFKYVAQYDGIVIIDDYYAWDGCSRAVHDFFTKYQLTARLVAEIRICIIDPRPKMPGSQGLLNIGIKC